MGDEMAGKIIQVDGVRPVTDKKKKKRRLVAFVAFIVLAAAGASILWLAPGKKIKTFGDYTIAVVTEEDMISYTEASGSVILPTQVSIVSPQEGYADSLNVKEGDSVGTETILAKLDVPELEDKQDDLQVELSDAELVLEELKVDFEFTIKNLERSISRLNDDIIEAEEDVQTMQELASLKSSRESDYENALEVLEDLIEQREDSTSDLYKQLRKQNISLKKQESVINQLKVDLERTAEDLSDTEIKSSISGEVLSLNEDLAVQGSLIMKNTALFTVADRTNTFIDLEVYEEYAEELEIGGEMSITIGSTTIKAEIVQTGKVAALSSDGLAATVTVRARPLTDTVLTPGASAVADIPLGLKKNVLQLPRGGYLTTGNNHVYVVKGATAYKTQVTFGQIEGIKVEILKGLEAGDEVIISGYQHFIDQEVIKLKSKEK